jgi:hypothetical protein
MGFDTKDFVKETRGMNMTSHVSQNLKRAGGSAIDGRPTRHGGHEISQRKRKRIEKIFGWIKTVGELRKARHRGLERVGWVFTFTAAAYNLVRVRSLMTIAVPALISRGQFVSENVQNAHLAPVSPYVDDFAEQISFQEQIRKEGRTVAGHFFSSLPRQPVWPCSTFSHCKTEPSAP